MSISVQTDIFCDSEGKNCRYWVGTGCTSNVIQARKERRNAREEGWIRRYNKKKKKWEDICPNCLDERK